MLNTKKIIVAFALALTVAAGTVAPAEAGRGGSTSTPTGGGWCC